MGGLSAPYFIWC